MNKKLLAVLLLSLFLSPAQKVLAADYDFVDLKVPFTSEIPNGSWVKPWNNACEEASIVMVEGYYFGYEKTTKSIAIKNMSPLFKIEDKLFGSNADTDSSRTAKLINDYTDFTATIKENPTLDEIKSEIKSGHPVITFSYAKNLNNPNHRWRAGGSYYHVMVLTGFDDKTKEFLTNDSGDPQTGEDYRYKYDAIMNSLHDFNHQTHQANGPARVIFTTSKVLFKEKNNPAVYLIDHDTKYPIASSKAFLNHGWKWKQINVVSAFRMNQFKTGEMITA